MTEEPFLLHIFSLFLRRIQVELEPRTKAQNAAEDRQEEKENSELALSRLEALLSETTTTTTSDSKNTDGADRSDKVNELKYRSSIRIMVRPENLLHLQHTMHHNPVVRSNSLEGITSSSSSSSSSNSEIARTAKKMSSTSLARKISAASSDLQDSDLNQPSIVKEQFR